MTEQTAPQEHKGDAAPPNNLPDWDECIERVSNSTATELHRFIYAYDDANPFRSAWFMHRLELVLMEAKAAALGAQGDSNAGL